MSAGWRGPERALQRRSGEEQNKKANRKKKGKEDRSRGLRGAQTHVMMFKIHHSDEPGLHKKTCLLHYSWDTDCLAFFGIG